MHVDQAPDAGKFRAVAASGLDAQAGTWGDTDLVNVLVDSNGEIALASGTDCDGVIWTEEGHQANSDGSKHTIVGGRKYTVFRQGELVDADVGSSPALSAGDKIWAQASGDVSVSATPGVGSIFIGHVMDDGKRIVLNVNGKEPSTA